MKKAEIQKEVDDGAFWLRYQSFFRGWHIFGWTYRNHAVMKKDGVYDSLYLTEHHIDAINEAISACARIAEYEETRGSDAATVAKKIREYRSSLITGRDPSIKV